MAKRRKNSRDKGQRGERALAQELTRLFGVACRRGQQYCGAAGDADCVGLPGVHIESKWVEQLRLRDAVQQAVTDAASTGNVPVVCHKRNHEPWLVTVRLEELPELARRLVAILNTANEQA